MLPKIIVIQAVFALLASATIDVELEPSFKLKIALHFAWRYQKVDVFKLAIKNTNDIHNVTLMAWQNVYNEDKTLKEIRTVELTLKQKVNKVRTCSKGNGDNVDGGKVEDDILKKVQKLKESFEQAHTLGMSPKLSYEEYDKDGKLTTEVYLERNFLYTNTNEFSVFNMTLCDTKHNVTNHLHSRPKTVIPILLLWYDKDDKLMRSRISPNIMVSVTKIENASHKMIEKATSAFASALVRNPNNIPRFVTKQMTHKYPKYFWNVVKNFDDYFVCRNVVIKMKNNLSELGQINEIYTLFGCRKKKPDVF